MSWQQVKLRAAGAISAWFYEHVRIRHSKGHFKSQMSQSSSEIIGDKLSAEDVETRGNNVI